MNDVAYEEDFDKEALKRLLSLTKNMDIEPSRNDLCYCMSGKKYKKCCINKEKLSKAEPLRFKEFYLVLDTDPEVFQYDMSDEDYHAAADCYELLLAGEFEEDPETLKMLAALTKKYPSHPILNIAQVLIHWMNGEDGAFENGIKNLLEKFPNSPMGPLLAKYREYDLYANQFFSRLIKQVEEAPPKELELKNIYEQEHIPLTEFLFTLSLQIYEALFQDKLNKALHLVDMMVDILERMDWSDHFLLTRMKHLLIIAKLARRMKIFLANYSKEEASHHGAVSVNA